MCTVENNPRQPADCAIYVFMKTEAPDDGSSLGAGFVSVTTNESVVVLGGADGNTKEHVIFQGYPSPPHTRTRHTHTCTPLFFSPFFHCLY